MLDTVYTIENYYTTIDNHKHKLKYEKHPEAIENINRWIDEYKEIVQKHVENANSILDKTTPADVDTLIKILPNIQSRIYRDRPADDDENTVKQIIVDAVIATISKHQGKPYTIDEKEKRKFELTQQLGYIEHELVYLEKVRHSSYQPPEISIAYMRYKSARDEIRKQLAAL